MSDLPIGAVTPTPYPTRSAASAATRVVSPFDTVTLGGSTPIPPPNSVPLAAPPDVPAQARSAGKWALFAGGAIALVLGGMVVGGIINLNPSPPASEIYQTSQASLTRSEARALRQLDFLERSAQPFGGGFQREAVFGIRVDINSGDAFKELRQGKTVYWQEMKDGQWQSMRNYDELTDVTNRTRAEQIRREIDGELQDFKDNLRDLEQIFRDIFRSGEGGRR